MNLIILVLNIFKHFRRCRSRNGHDVPVEDVPVKDVRPCHDVLGWMSLWGHHVLDENVPAEDVLDGDILSKSLSPCYVWTSCP